MIDLLKKTFQTFYRSDRGYTTNYHPGTEILMANPLTQWAIEVLNSKRARPWWTHSQSCQNICPLITLAISPWLTFSSTDSRWLAPCHRYSSGKSTTHCRRKSFQAHEPVIYNVLETVHKEEMLVHLFQCSLLTTQQHGFFLHRSIFSTLTKKVQLTWFAQPAVATSLLQRIWHRTHCNRLG